MADHQPLQELREASRRVLVSIKAVPGRLREALTASPNKVRNRILAAGCCAAAALLVGAGAWAAAAPGALPVPGEPPAAADQAADDGAAGPVAVALEVSAEGYTEQSSPLVAVVTGTEGATVGTEGAEVDFAHAVSAEEVSSGTASVELAPGTYTVSFVSPVNQDGSIYRVPEPQEVTVAAPDAGAEPEAPRVDVELDPVPADQVTKEDLDTIKSDLADAVAKGDGTLSGDAGSQATSKAEENASKAPASKPAEEGQKPEEQKPAEEKPAAGGGQASGSSNGGSSGGGQSSGGGSSSGGQSSSSGGSSGGGQSSGGSGSSGGGSTAPAKKWVPEKGHYEPVYENVWVPNVQYIRHPKFVCNGCGYTTTTDAQGAHCLERYEAGDMNHGSFLDDSYTETVDNGRYEKKQTGQKWVVDVPGHWE